MVQVFIFKPDTDVYNLLGPLLGYWDIQTACE